MNPLIPELLACLNTLRHHLESADFSAAGSVVFEQGRILEALEQTLIDPDPEDLEMLESCAEANQINGRIIAGIRPFYHTVWNTLGPGSTTYDAHARMREPTDGANFCDRA